jgi:GH24 family phage-related lysozyme (muramidase)
MTNAISASGLALIQEFEGFHAEPKQLPDGGWVVGYNHIRTEAAGEPVDPALAAELLALDVAPFENLVNALVTQPLSQSQFDALASFAFSVGAEAFEASQTLRRVNAGDFTAAAYAMEAWRKSEVSGELVVVEALVRRRAAEKALFLQGASAAAPSSFVRPQLDHAASILGAPIVYAPLPELGSILPVEKIAPAERLTEILCSEPATEALLLTQVVADEVAADDEITTAHAKPVAREEFEPRMATRRKAEPKTLNFPAISKDVAIETAGLAALMLFGLGLVTAAFAMLSTTNAGVADITGAAALGAPGVAAVLMAAFGFWRAPQPKPVRAEP